MNLSSEKLRLPNIKINYFSIHIVVLDVELIFFHASHKNMDSTTRENLRHIWFQFLYPYQNW